MTAKYKVIGKVTKPKHLLGVYEIPDDAIWLVQDIATLEIMQTLLDRLQERSFVARGDASYAERKTEAWKVMRRLAFVISLLKEVAEQNLVHDYLGGAKIPRRKPRQSIAEVWQLLWEGFKP